MDIDVNAAAVPDSSASDGGFLSSRLFAAVRVIATLAIVVGLIYKLKPSELASTIRDADLGLLVAALALMIVVQVMVVVKWLVLLRARDVHAPTAQVVKAYCVGNLLSNVLPTAVGGDVYRVYRIQREAGARAADVTMSVLYERATGYGAMTCLGALGAAFYYGSVPIGLAALAGGGVAALMLAVVLPRLPLPVLREDHVIRNLVAHRREFFAVSQMFVFSLAIQALNISSIALIGRALGIHSSWAYWAFVTWVVAIAVLFPLTLGGLGVREGGFALRLKHAGATAAQGASTGFALGLLLIFVNAAGLVAIVTAERLGWIAPQAPDTPAPASPVSASAQRSLTP